MASLTTSGIVLLVFLIIFSLLTVLIYIEEIIFIMKTFKIGYRKKKTIWVLSCFPMWSVLGLIAVCVPKSGPLIDMISSMYFGTCLYNFGKLMINYMGGAKGLWKVIGLERRIQTNTLPVCCCCLCLPKMHFSPVRYFIINILVMQTVIVRPLLWFIAAVLWTNNAYFAGLVSPRHSYIYIILTNVISTSTAVYALMLFRNAFRPELEKKFFIMGKFASVQLTLVLGSIPLFILAILIGNGVITCSPIMTTKGKADEIYHIMLVLLMLPLSLLARKSYRRVEDGSMYAERLDSAPQQQPPQLGGENSDMLKVPLANDQTVVVVPNYGQPAAITDANGNSTHTLETKSLTGRLEAADESNV